jgi:hypothetical protein
MHLVQFEEDVHVKQFEIEEQWLQKKVEEA